MTWIVAFVSAGLLLVGCPQQSAPPAPTTLYVEPDNPHARQAALWATSRPADAAVMSRVAAQPSTLWIASDYPGYTPQASEDYVRGYVDRAEAANGIAVLVLYSIPLRDCNGQWSAGGSSSDAEYRGLVGALSRGIGARHVIVIVEPDALADLDCLPQTAEGAGRRLNLIREAVAVLAALPHTGVFIDAGNPPWNCPECIAWRLNHAGVDQADGFSVNVNTYHDLAAVEAYGRAISPLVGGKLFVVDTGRNGAGAGVGDWCNPTGVALGRVPTLGPKPGVAAYLWVTPVGQSDGDCGRGEPPAGAWWPERALELARLGGF